MPHRHSAVKKLRQDKKRRQHNIAVKLRIKKTLRKFQETLKEKPNEAKTVLKELSSLLDKAAKRGIIHKNTASRKKSRLNKRLNKLQQAPTQQAAKPD
jgi:small subunit ribosomal protein S20